MGLRQSACCKGNEDKFNVAGDESPTSVADDSSPKGKEPLTQAEISIVEENWRQVQSLGEEAVGIILFKHIFTDAPEALQLFSFRNEFNLSQYESAGLKAHVAKVVGTVGVAVEGLRDIQKLTPVLKELGLKHSGYGVQPEHYDIVGAAFIKTLRDGLGDKFTYSSNSAWTKVFALVSESMQAGVKLKDDLTPAEMSLVESTWKQVEAIGAETVGVILFKNIFELAPEAKGLFSFKDEANVYDSPKLKTHAVNVVNHVGTAVANLRDLAKIIPVLQELGKRHAGYGVKPAHYDVVGKALLKTLKTGLDKAYTPEVEVAWTKVFAVVQKTMLSSVP